MFTVGTAGHVDHGKSTLIEALTGIDPDRLREEKARGMTIDLGFAWLRLPDGREISIVDVPGHERFIKNMLAGVGGIDAALLVIAADEGIMPQTREHLDILDLIGVNHGVVALTKADLVDDEWRAFVAEEVRETLRGTSLSGASIVPISALAGTGLPDLVSALGAVLDHAPVRRDLGRPRMPIDRVFSLAGFGTIVTGTLRDGSLEVGQELEVLPDGLRTRARGLQSHPVAVARDDDFIIRALSPGETLGGGRIVDAHPAIRRRRQTGLVAALEALADGSPEDVVVGTLARIEPASSGDLVAACGLMPAIALPLIEALLAQGEIVPLGGMNYTRGGWNRISDRLVSVLDAYHGEFPLRPFMPKEELKNRLGLPTRVFAGALARLVSLDSVVDGGTGIRASGHHVRFAGASLLVAEAITTAIGRLPLSPPTLTELTASIAEVRGAPSVEEVVGALVATGALVKASEEVYFDRNSFDEMVTRVESHFRIRGEITVAEARDLIGTSRKYVLPFLEYLDREKVTRRNGDLRLPGTRRFGDLTRRGE
ncbi:MAG: selenocysteine-specific translation elongation factor [Chloroflexi bacterium]|nr:selenocysteine-specific translation elongation factor [Chloroflexota bacterium]